MTPYLSSCVKLSVVPLVRRLYALELKSIDHGLLEFSTDPFFLHKEELVCMYVLHLVAKQKYQLKYYQHSLCKLNNLWPITPIYDTSSFKINHRRRRKNQKEPVQKMCITILAQVIYVQPKKVSNPIDLLSGYIVKCIWVKNKFEKIIISTIYLLYLISIIIS